MASVASTSAVWVVWVRGVQFVHTLKKNVNALYRIDEIFIEAMSNGRNICIKTLANRRPFDDPFLTGHQHWAGRTRPRAPVPGPAIH